MKQNKYEEKISLLESELRLEKTRNQVLSVELNYYKKKSERYESEIPKMIEKCKECGHFTVCFMAQNEAFLYQSPFRDCNIFIPKENEK
jgi:hypothetical protein